MSLVRAPQCYVFICRLTRLVHIWVQTLNRMIKEKFNRYLLHLLKRL